MQQKEKEIKNSEDVESFSFTYSAKEQEEIMKIRQKYQPEEENKMDQLRRMDASVTKKASVVSILLGTLGTLVLGTGMSIIMTEFGSFLRVSETVRLVFGIILGSAGLVILGLACPLYYHMVKKEREKIAPEILKLTEELMK